MDNATIDRTSRGVSPLLLLLAALAFLLLPVIGVSCNTQAAQPLLGAAVSSLSGGSAGSAQLQQAQGCLAALSNRDLVAYSGTSLAFGRNPNVDSSSPSSCNFGNSSTGSGSAGLNTAQNGVGVQPLFLAGLIVLIAGVLCTVLRAPVRNLAVGAAAVVSAALFLVGASAVHGAINDQINSSSGTNTLSSLGISNSISAYFDIHGTAWLWLVVALLGLVFVVNLLAVLRLQKAPPAPLASAWGGGPAATTWPPPDDSPPAPPP